MDVDVPEQALSILVPTRLKLLVAYGPCEGQIFDSNSLNSAFLTVGRTKKSKIFLKDPAISEKHAEIAWNGKSGFWTLRDTDSSNGTRVNGAVLKPYCAHPLKAGDLVTFGCDTNITIELEQQTLKDVSMEVLFRAIVESVCQDIEATTEAAANEMVRRSNEVLDALLVPPEDGKP